MLTKKDAECESRELALLGAKGELQPGDSTSDSTQTTPERWWEVNIRDLGEEGSSRPSGAYLQKFLC